MTYAGLVGPYAVVLALGGLAKLRRPGSLAPALATLGIRAGPAPALALGLVEVGLSATLVVVGGLWPDIAGAAWFALLTATSIVLVRRGYGIPCGCFGDDSAPPDAIHTAANAVGAALLAVAAVAGSGGLLDGLTDEPLPGALLIAQVALGAWLLLAVYRDLPPTVRHRPDVAELGLVDRR